MPTGTIYTNINGWLNRSREYAHVKDVFKLVGEIDTFACVVVVVLHNLAL